MKTTQLIHDISQNGYKVELAGDFSGMLRITYIREATPGVKKEYIRHEHLSYPDSSMEELNEALNKSLNDFLKEISNGGEPKSDGL